MQERSTPADPFSFRYLIYLRKKGALLSHVLQGSPGNLCELLNGKFYSRPILEWQLSVADWGEKKNHKAEFVC